MRYAVIDTGSNTIRLGIYEYENDQQKMLYNRAIFANLAGFIKDGTLSSQGIEAATDAILEHLKVAQEYGCTPNVFATAAIRNAHNTEEICEKIKKKTGLFVDVLSGEEEAIYSFYGAAPDFACSSGVVADVGGGSSEVIVFSEKTPVACQSVPFGSLKSYHAFVNGTLPTMAEVYAIRQAITDQLKQNEAFCHTKSENLCIVGGGVRASTKLAKAFLGKNALSMEVLDAILSIITETPQKAQAVIEEVAPERALTIAPALAIYTAVGEWFGSSTVFVSDNGIKEGYILKKLRK